MISDQNLKAVLILRDDFGMDPHEIVDNFASAGVTIFRTDVPAKKPIEHCIEFNGIRRTAEDWGKLYSIKPGTLRKRLERGWPIERALGQKPLKPRRKKCTQKRA
jgi:hypothetical protein